MRQLIFLILLFTLTSAKSQTKDSSVSNRKCEIKDTIDYITGDYLISMTLNKECYHYDVKIINQKNKKTLYIPNQLKCVFFGKVENDIVVFDYGTSLRRIEYFYDLKQEKIIDTLNILGCCLDSVVNPDKCFFALIIPDEKIMKLKLPKCDTEPKEFNGYIEEVYYDFQQRKIIHTGHYKCI